MAEDMIELDFILVEKILNQLILSDGMKVDNNYLIQQHIYYVDNVGVVEELESRVMEYYYKKLLSEHGYVKMDQLFEKYNPQYINSDKLFNQLEKRYNKITGTVKDKPDNNKSYGSIKTNLNKYL